MIKIGGRGASSSKGAGASLNLTPAQNDKFEQVRKNIEKNNDISNVKYNVAKNGDIKINYDFKMGKTTTNTTASINEKGHVTYSHKKADT